MKIGLSFSRCVRDIVDGIVNMDEVLVVISRTSFDPRVDSQWNSIWNGYHTRSGWSSPEWANYAPEMERRFREVSIGLWELGKLHQPRQFGAHPQRLPYYWVEAFVAPDDSNPAVKEAWENFMVVAGLCNVNVDSMKHNM